MTRSPGMYGCLPAQFPGGLSDLTYYVAGALEAPPPKVDVPAVAQWGMLANDQYGDCGVAGLQHAFMADASITHETENEPSAQQAVDYYLAYTNGVDSGVVLSAYLEHVRQSGYYGHRVEAYAPVTVHDVPTLQTAIHLFGAAYCGIQVTQSMESAFQQGQPWTTALLADPPIGGHCVPIVGYDDTYLYAITWGGVQPITYPAWHYISTEAWAVLAGELVARHGDGRGVNIDALKKDLARL